MEELVQQIILRLKQREKNVLVLSCRSPFDSCRGVKDFLDNRSIRVKDADVFFLKAFVEKDADEPLVRWIYQSYEYGCCVLIQLSFSEVELVPEELINNAAVTLFNKQGKQYFTFPNKIITYKQVALLDEKQILLLSPTQYLTALARDRIREKNIDIVERG